MIIFIYIHIYIIYIYIFFCCCCCIFLLYSQRLSAPIRIDISKIFEEPAFVLYCCIIAKLVQTKNSLLKYFDVHVGYI